MNELTKKMQEIMVPKAALIAYEYRESAYATGKNYLELRPINKAGRMEAGIPVTYEFMNALVESLFGRKAECTPRQAAFQHVMVRHPERA